MELLEYQAKKLFCEVGIPVLPSQSIKESRELKQLQIPYPVVLKSQVRARGRGKAGGIHFVENTIDAIASARTIFNLAIQGEYPEVLLAEARYNSMAEFFLGIVLDYQLCCPVLVGSVKGGMNVEPLLENLQKVAVDEEFSPFYARKLTTKMGLQGKLIQSVSEIIEKMYYLFYEKDLELVEINPLGISAEGEVMALDGKITVNDYALARHPDIVSLTNSHPLKNSVITYNANSFTGYTEPEIVFLNGVDTKGNLAIISNSVDLARLTWDLVTQEGGKVSSCAVVKNPKTDLEKENALYYQKIKQALEQILSSSGLKTILINIVGNSQINQTLVLSLSNYLQKRFDSTPKMKGENRMERATGTLSRRDRKPKEQSYSRKQQQEIKLVIRLVSEDLNLFKQTLTSIPIYWTDNLETAVTQTISFAKAK